MKQKKSCLSPLKGVSNCLKGKGSNGIKAYKSNYLPEERLSAKTKISLESLVNSPGRSSCELKFLVLGSQHPLYVIIRDVFFFVFFYSSPL